MESDRLCKKCGHAAMSHGPRMFEKPYTYCHYITWRCEHSQLMMACEWMGAKDCPGNQECRCEVFE